MPHEHAIWQAINAGEIARAVLQSQQTGAPPCNTAERAIVWACVMAAAPYNGDGDLLYFASSIRKNPRDRLRPMRTIMSLGHAIRDVDSYVIAAMVGRIRNLAPRTNRAMLAGLLIPIAEGREPKNTTWWIDALDQISREDH